MRSEPTIAEMRDMSDDVEHWGYCVSPGCFCPWLAQSWENSGLGVWGESLQAKHGGVLLTFLRARPPGLLVKMQVLDLSRSGNFSQAPR